MTSDEYVVNELLEAKKQAEWLQHEYDRYADLFHQVRELIAHLSPERLSTGTIYFRNDTVSGEDPGYALLETMLKGEE